VAQARSEADGLYDVAWVDLRRGVTEAAWKGVWLWPKALDSEHAAVVDDQGRLAWTAGDQLFGFDMTTGAQWRTPLEHDEWGAPIAVDATA
jgi:hypothetical protein